MATSCADVAGFALLQRRRRLYLGLDALARAAVMPFAAIVFAVYYFDLRVRQEGYDLGCASKRLQKRAATTISERARVQNGVQYAPTRYLSGEERALVAALSSDVRRSTRPYRRDLAARIADPVRARVPEDLAPMDDEALLERL